MALGNSRVVRVLITGDASNFNKAVGDVEKSAGRLSSVAKGALLGAGAAIGAGAIKAVTGFEKAALAARDFSVASGLSGREAARWQEAAQSVGVESDTLAKSIGRLTKNLGGNEDKFKALGVTVARNAKGQVDANKTFLNAIQVIHDIQDPLKRADVASQLFGKSWQDLAPLIEMGAAGISDELAKVSDAQAKVGDPASIEKAKKFQAAMDDLRDRATQLGFSFAQGVLPVVTAFATLVSTIPAPVLATGAAILGVAAAASKLSGAMAFLAANPWIAIIGGIAAAAILLAQNWDKVTAAVRGAQQAFADLVGKIPGGNFVANVLGGFKTSKALRLPGPNGSVPARAMGGPVMAGSPYMVGERGPELFVPSSSGSIVPNGVGGVVINLNGPVSMRSEDDLRKLAELLERERRRQARGGVRTAAA